MTGVLMLPDPQNNNNLRGSVDVRYLQSSTMKLSVVDYNSLVTDRKDSSAVLDRMIASSDTSGESHTSSAYNSYNEKETFLVFDPDH